MEVKLDAHIKLARSMIEIMNDGVVSQARLYHDCETTSGVELDTHTELAQ